MANIPNPVTEMPSLSPRLRNLYDELFGRELREYLEKLAFEMASRVGIVHQPNPAYLRKIAADLWKLRAPELWLASSDQYWRFRLHVDIQDDFTLPLTVVRNGRIESILFRGEAEGVPVPAQMRDMIVYEDRKTFRRQDIASLLWGRLNVAGTWNDTMKSVWLDVMMLPLNSQNGFTVDNHPLVTIHDTEDWIVVRDCVIGPNGQEYQYLEAYEAKRGEHPLPLTIVWQDMVYHPIHNKDGFLLNTTDMDWGYQYPGELVSSQTGKPAELIIPHTLWDDHCKVLTWGASITPASHEVAMLHSYVRRVDIVYMYKGMSKKVEHLGAGRPQVVLIGDENAQENMTYLKIYEIAHEIGADGQLKSHCVKTSLENNADMIEQAFPDVTDNNGRVITDNSAIRLEQFGKFNVLGDQMTTLPGTESNTAKSYARMSAAGLRETTGMKFLESALVRYADSL